MPSPFPGTDPWLEGPRMFPDLHDALITYLGDALCAVLPEPYFARSATRVWMDDEQQREPDVSLLDNTFHGDRPTWPGMTQALTAVGMIAVEAAAGDSDPFEETFLEVRSTEGDRLVTAVEVLSLSNKTPGDKGRAAYRRKQSEYLREGVALVEIDLLRGGQHTTAVSLTRLRATAGAVPYHVCVSAPFFDGQRFVSPIRLADPLPTLSVPLDHDVPPVAVALQPLLDQAYDRRLYRRQLRYTSPPEPPLTADQQAWAEGILRVNGLIA